jgi:hypothetical protein
MTKPLKHVKRQSKKVVRWAVFFSSSVCDHFVLMMIRSELITNSLQRPTGVSDRPIRKRTI